MASMARTAVVSFSHSRPTAATGAAAIPTGGVCHSSWSLSGRRTVTSRAPAPKELDSPNPGPYNVHDFGSILAFIENNFLGQNGIGGINSASDNDGSGGYSGSGYLFADAYYPEG